MEIETTSAAAAKNEEIGNNNLWEVGGSARLIANIAYLPVISAQCANQHYSTAEVAAAATVAV